MEPSTGHFQCDSPYFAAGSNCHFKCPLGMLPGGDKTITCKATLDESGNAVSFDWDKDVSKFECVSTIT